MKNDTVNVSLSKSEIDTLIEALDLAAGYYIDHDESNSTDHFETLQERLEKLLTKS